MPDYKIFITTDESDKYSGTVLSFGPSWESACPVAFDSMMFKNAELIYLVHKKELLAVIHVLKKWCVNLLGSPFFIYTDHKTLENFNIQKDPSQCQACWMEFMSQFNAKIMYIKGDENTVADALSKLPSSDAQRLKTLHGICMIFVKMMTILLWLQASGYHTCVVLGNQQLISPCVYHLLAYLHHAGNHSR